MLPSAVECRNWLEAFIKANPRIEPIAVYAAGKALGFSRADIKAARRWFGKYIETDESDGRTLWSWYR